MRSPTRGPLIQRGLGRETVLARYDANCIKPLAGTRQQRAPLMTFMIINISAIAPTAENPKPLLAQIARRHLWREKARPNFARVANGALRQTLSTMADNRAALYGILSVGIALAAGFGVGILFRKGGGSH